MTDAAPSTESILEAAPSTSLSFFQKIRTAIGNHRKKIIWSMLGIGLAGGIHYLTRAQVEQVYNGTIDSNPVTYQESTEGLFSSPQNRAVVKKGTKTYTLIDNDSCIEIDWKNEQAPDFSKDSLETVIIAEGKTSRTYESAKSNSGTIDGKHTETIFGKANILYRDLRGKIRTEVRNKYTADNKPVEDSF